MSYIAPKPGGFWKLILLFFGALLLIPVTVLLVAWLLSGFGLFGQLLALLLLVAFVIKWIYNMVTNSKR